VANVFLGYTWSY